MTFFLLYLVPGIINNFQIDDLKLKRFILLIKLLREGGNCYKTVGVFRQFDRRDTLIYLLSILIQHLLNTPIFFQLKSKIRPTFANFDKKSPVFGTIITNLTKNGAYYALLIFLKHHLKS